MPIHSIREMNVRAAPRTIIDATKLEARLRYLGLSSQILIKAREAGITWRSEATQDHPPNWAGLQFWGATLRELRFQTRKLGWTSETVQGIACTVSPDRRIAICVQTGDKLTGDCRGIPRTGNSKGSGVQSAVARNRQTLLPFPDDISSTTPIAEHMKMFVLLIYPGDGVFRAELSFPTGLDAPRQDGDNGRLRISAWMERMILPDIHKSELPTPDPADDEPELDIPISVTLV